MDAGTRVNVRYVRDGIGGARLERNPQWAVAIVEIALGAVLLLAAAVTLGVFGALPSLGRRVHRLQTTAVVTAVERVEYRGGPRWRVRFAYLDDLGGSREAADEFAVDTWKVGEVGVAVFDVADPNIAYLRREDAAAARIDVRDLRSDNGEARRPSRLGLKA
jgi:hypothetical protein